MSLRDQMEEIYQGLPAERIPWNLKEPPELLVDLVRGGRVQPCDAVDVGCGVGNYSVWLAKQGFQMTGIDISPSALALARQLARENSVTCQFIEEDLSQEVSQHDGAFDFGFDWEVLHHVFPQWRETYVANIHRMLQPGGMHLSVCFSERDRDFGGSGKYRKTPLGTTLYFSSEEEIERLFAPQFQILELDSKEVVGKYGPHVVVLALLKRE